jgi:molybdopterin-guanine dinucleotide biosynthesis protein A
MGRSKTDLFLPRVVAAASPVFDDVIAVQRKGEPALAIRTIHEAEHADEAPVFGVIRALEDAGAPAFVLAVDYPLVTTAALLDLLRRFRTSRARMLVPVWRGIPQPLCAGYREDVLPLIRERIDRRKLDLIGLMKEASAETFVFDGRELMNVNTPEELAKAERLE